MTEKPHGPQISRRHLFQMAGVSATALATHSFTSSRVSALNAQGIEANTLLRIGVLLPKTTPRYPSLARSFLQGLRTHLGHTCKLLVGKVATGYSPSAQLIREYAEKGPLDLLVGIVGTHTAERLCDTLHACGTPMIVCGAGANVVSQVDSHLYYSTLSSWQSAWAAGRWSAQQMGKRAVMASSLYDSGYDALYAFQLGYEGAGGEVVRTRVSYDISDRGEILSLMAAIAHYKPDVVYASYSGSDADYFLRAYAEAGLGARTHLVASPFLSERASHASTTSALHTIGCMSWPSGGDVVASSDPFVTLGRDTAEMIASAATTIGAAERTPETWGKALASASLDSLRGRLAMDPDRHSLSAPLHIQEIDSRGGATVCRPIVDLEPVPESDSVFDPLRSGIRAGWIHAYLAD